MVHPALKPGTSSGVRDMLGVAPVSVPEPAGGRFTFWYCYHVAVLFICSFYSLWMRLCICENFLWEQRFDS